MNDVPFVGFSKISRLNREVIVTEKIDGTNAQICVTEDGRILTGSRTRWITPESDNYGFAAWVRDHAEELMELGPGQHFGEWWGQGIQRNYGLKEKRFSLFNTLRWGPHRELGKWPEDTLPVCCHVVPVIWKGLLADLRVWDILSDLGTNGSFANPGYMNPEGFVAYHTASRVCFKMTLANDVGKSLV